MLGALDVVEFRRPQRTSHRNPTGVFADTSQPSDLINYLLRTGILSDFGRQFHRVSLPPRGPRPQEPRCDRAPRLPPKYLLRPQRILRHCLRRGKQQPRAL